MALGIEQNSIAPQLIQNSGQALVQGIRQIGQQISGHLTEMQTKRDLGALSQEMQSVNPMSAEFPVQLTQLVARHPMAAKDERGQMLLSILGKANGQWQASQADALAFQRQMKMQEMRDTSATTRAAAAEKARSGRPVSVFGVGLVDPVSGETLVPEGSRGGSAGPKTLSPGSILVDPTGKKIAENPRVATPGSSEARLAKKNKIDLLMRQDAQLQRDLADHVKRRDTLSKQRMETEKESEIAYLDNTVKAIEKEASDIQKRRFELQEAIGAIGAEDQVEPELVGVPAGAVAPPPAAAVIPPMGAEPAAPAGEVLPPLGAIQGPVRVKSRAEVEKLPKGTQYLNPDGRIFTKN